MGSTDALAQLEATLASTQQPTAPLRHSQIEAYHKEMRRLGAIVDQQDAEGRPGQTWIGGEPALAQRRIREIRKTLAEHTAKRLTGPAANTVHALASQVIAEVIKPGMLPKSVMRRNPTGAVGEYQRREGSRVFKRAALAVKRAIRALDPENPDPDLANLERFRPEGAPSDGTASFMADATIPGHFAMSDQAKANWPLGDPTADTALRQAERVARTKPDGRRKPRTAAQRAATERMRAARLARAESSEPITTG